MSNKEKRGIYNVTLNEKSATAIKTDIELIEKAIIEEVIYYVKGWHNERRNKGMGAEHIKLHLEKGSEGEIKIEELLNLGNSIREYIKIFNEPYLEDKNKSGKVYEWQNDEGIKFRVAIDNKGEGLIPPLSPSGDVIISFYSDRNINKAMEFKNPKVKEYYENKEIRTPTSYTQEKEQTQTKHTKDKSYFQNKMQTFNTNKAVKTKDKER